MNVQVEKLYLIQQIIQVNDDLLLKALKNLLDFGLQRQSGKNGNAEVDFWNELTAEQKAKIENSIRQLEAGQGIPHAVVMNEFRQKYQR